jgi:hypothetical protein
MYRYRAAPRRGRRDAPAGVGGRQAHLVAEVEPVGDAHEPFVGGVRLRQLALARRALGERLVVGVGRRGGLDLLDGGQVRGRTDVLVAEPADERDECRQEARRVAERTVSVQRQLEQVLAQEDDLLRPREHGRPIRQPRLERVLAQEPVAKGVEGADLSVVVPVRDEPVDALHHLERGAVGEGQGQDLRRERPLLGDEPRDPPGDDRRLAGPRPRHDQERTFAVRHRLALARRQVGEEGRLDAKVRPARPGSRDQLLEDRQLIWRWDDRWHLVDGSGGPIHPAVIAAYRTARCRGCTSTSCRALAWHPACKDAVGG